MPIDPYAGLGVEEVEAIDPYAGMGVEAPVSLSAASTEEDPYAGMGVEDAPATESPITPEIRATEGFWNTIESPITMMKKESIPAHLIKYFTTTKEEFDVANASERKDAIHSTPILESMNQQLDRYERRINEGVASPEQIEQFGLLQDAYGDMYQKIEAEYEKGGIDPAEIVGGLIDAFKNDAGGTTAEMLNSLMATPELMLTPVGWEKAAMSAAKLGATKAAQTAAGMTGAGVTAGGVVGLESATADLAETGEVDPVGVAVDTSLGAFFGAATVGTLKGGSKLLGDMAERKLPKQVEAARDMVRERAIELIEDSHLRQMPTEQAVKRAIVETKMSPDVRSKLSGPEELKSEKYFISDEEVAAKGSQLADEMLSWKGKLKTTGKRIAETIDDTLGATTTRLSIIDPSLGHSLKRHDMQQAARIKGWLDIKDEYIDMLDSVPKKKIGTEGLTLRTKAEQLINNGEPEQLRELLIDAKIPDVEGKMNVLTKVYEKMDQDFADAKAAGIKMGGEAGKFYFPRSIKNYEALMQRRGYRKTEVDKALAKFINRKYKAINKNFEPVLPTTLTKDKVSKYLSNQEVTKAFNEYFGGRADASGASTSHVAPRVFDRIASNEMVDYADTVEALNEYIINMSGKIQVGKFFGGKAIVEGDDAVKKSIGEFAAKLYNSGKITNKDQEAVKKLLFARFVESARQTSPTVAALKDIGYIATLANPLSAGTQLGDIGSSFYLTNAADTVTSMGKVLSGKAELNMKEMGLDNIVQEFEHLRPTAKILKKSLAMSGFSAVDRLGKNTILNASLRQYRRMAKDVKGRNDIRDKYRDAFTPKQMNKMLDDLEKGDVMTDDIKYLAWHELSRAQPISMSEMPLHYLRHPNARMFYALKTFTIKQLDAIRRDAYLELKAGKPGKATANLVRHAGILGISNAGVEEVKAWVQGKENPEFDDLVYTTMIRNYGISQWLLEREKPSEAIISLVTPPFLGVIDDITSFIAGSDKRMTSFSGLRKTKAAITGEED
jgi:hypothetical protein